MLLPSVSIIYAVNFNYLMWSVLFDYNLRNKDVVLWKPHVGLSKLLNLLAYK